MTMAVRLVTATKSYTGSSQDEKPTSGVPAGSVFHEFTDGEPPTVRRFLFDGSEWGLVITTPPEEQG